MMWRYSWRADPRARALADQHYNRQSIRHVQFVPPGRACVLYAETPHGRAFWVTSYPLAEFVHHAWAGAWICSAFRNEGAGLASTLIVEAIAATRAQLGEPPALGMITFVNPRKVRPIRVRGRIEWGWCFKRAGFREVGRTKKDDLIALQLVPAAMPAACRPLLELEAAALASRCALPHDR